jgi:hypothetical protein
MGAAAQDTNPATPDSKPMELGNFEVQGSITAGYRLESVGGRREKFMELFDLRSGPRLFDFNFSGNGKEGASPFADHFQLDASGWGGDPFPSGQFIMSKTKVYDLRVNLRQTYYYWDRNDNALLPSGLHGLTTNQNWATVRKFASVNLLLHATNRLKFRIEYGRNSRDGINDTTLALDYFGSPSTWGVSTRQSVLRRSSSERGREPFRGRIDYSLDRWSFHYTLGYLRFTQSLNWNVNTPERSINIDSTANTKEFLNIGSWVEHRNLKTPSSEFVYNGAVNSRLSMRGDFMFFRYSGPATLDASFAGTVRANTAGTQVSPYSVLMSSRAQVSEPNYVLDQGFTYKLTEWWNVHADYRYNRFTEDTTALEHSRDLTTTFDGTANQQWRQGLHQADLSFEFLPVQGLVIRPGIRFTKRDTTALEDGVANPTRSERVRTVWPIASVAYIPSKKFSIRADVQSITNGASYTRITPHTDVGSRWVVRYQPFRRLSIENSFVIRNRKLVGADFYSNTRQNASTVSWAWNDRFSSFAGFSYDSFLATASVNFLRGTPPINTTWADQTINRVWQAGLTARPFRRTGVSFAGNFVRSTGASVISGELSNFGPLTFPMATAPPITMSSAWDAFRSICSAPIISKS